MDYVEMTHGEKFKKINVYYFIWFRKHKALMMFGSVWRAFCINSWNESLPGVTFFLQDENDDDDDWNPCKAAGVCLMLLSTCCEDDIVPHVLPFIKEHIKNPDWRYRDAAVMAFGSILEGPEPNQLKPLVIQVKLEEMTEWKME